MDIQLETEIAALVTLGLFTLEECTVAATHPLIDGWLTRRQEEIRLRWGETTAGALEEIRPARTLYRAIGLDPTRSRPSSEALVRRAMQGRPLPRINSAVDLCNLAAVTYHLSIGLYDLDKLRPPLTARLGREGEHYRGLGKPRVNLAGRFVCSDGEGAFGNPSSDSLRTSVDLESRRLLWIIYAPAAYDRDTLAKHLDWSAGRALEAGLCRSCTPPLILPPLGGS